MTGYQLVFLITAAITVVSALMVVISPNLVHAALWLILTLAGVAVNFVLLDANFLAVVQVAVYIDAIAILIIVTVMLTRYAMGSVRHPLTRNWPWAALAALVLCGGLLVLINQIPRLMVEAPELTNTADGYIKELGRALVDVDRYVIPFEVASILLLAALIGAIIVARPPKEPMGRGEEE
jgi:NADH-quinone oxidoreductase subunit J